MLGSTLQNSTFVCFLSTFLSVLCLSKWLILYVKELSKGWLVLSILVILFTLCLYSFIFTSRFGQTLCSLNLAVICQVYFDSVMRLNILFKKLKDNEGVILMETTYTIITLVKIGLHIYRLREILYGIHAYLLLNIDHGT